MSQTYPSAGIVHEGSLTKYGYHLDEPEIRRHKALNKAEEKYGYAETIRKLAALEGVNKGHPNHQKVKDDIEYLQEMNGHGTGIRYTVKNKDETFTGLHFQSHEQASAYAKRLNEIDSKHRGEYEVVPNSKAP